MLFDRGWRGLALERLDVGGHRDGLNVFELLVTGTFAPSQELANCSVIGGSGMRVADRDRKKFEKLFADRWASARDKGWSCERI